jgi:hypothetical protein
MLCSLAGDSRAQISVLSPNSPNNELMPVPATPYSPRQHVCYLTTQKPVIDGNLDEQSWQNAQWTDAFVDIEGSLKPIPRFKTHAKMLWDSTFFYIGAELQEPDIWGTLTLRDAVIYHDNDFELFIDPDGDTHEYYELELNAMNTVWDLFLVKPYRDGGPAINAWDIQSLTTAVKIDGTLNKSGDIDTGWSVEIAIPWKVLAECAHRPSPPRNGDQWKVNFSRVEWRSEIENEAYMKTINPATGKSFPEDNWVWSPQGLIAMHYPEMWGIVQFTTAECGTKQVEFVPDPEEPARWALREIYYMESNFYKTNQRFTDKIDELKLEAAPPVGFTWPPIIEATPNLFQASLQSSDGLYFLSITQDGRITTEQR